MQDLRSLTTRVEQHGALPPGTNERFAGYGVMSLPFSSGYVLGLRRFPFTSVGPGYTSVWLRAPNGEWTIYTNVPPDVSCPRYFGNALSHSSVHSISIEWSDERRFVVHIGDDVNLTWRVTLAARPITRLMTGAMRLIPRVGWRSAAFLRGMGAVAGPALGAGRIALTGTTPNAQRFFASPKRIWFVEDSTAEAFGTDFGIVKKLTEQDKLGDFWMPQRGIFMIGSAAFDTFAPAPPIITAAA
ncbi:hypothetical protein L1277_002798 [Okibacterium sp. HSC-33S16]|uniref:hypothetical protein n=1 Tax=Okibacterium sp. HSC-33S16 TaxID=2910965 RepID=UPI00209EAE8E|nr:hypothetical protein [Okibacterium sp. HSC-33S16]MCP2032688.1 hypothetical protein [Okibacterium sp. HSC-33S16]